MLWGLWREMGREGARSSQPSALPLQPKEVNGLGGMMDGRGTATGSCGAASGSCGHSQGLSWGELSSLFCPGWDHCVGNAPGM